MDMTKYTHRTRSGLPARIICKGILNADYPVVAVILRDANREYVMEYTNELKYWHSPTDHDLDLVEYSPWADVAVDTPIWVRHSDLFKWLPRHFASFTDGVVYTWTDGNTSHTANGIVVDWACAALTLTKPQQ